MKESPQKTAAPACLHRLFEAQAARTPHATAAVLGAETLTYRELDRRANGIARRLRALGVGPETLVGLYAERSLGMLCALLGILKAGGAYVPFDPAYPRERLAFMIADAALPLILAPRRHLDAIPDSSSRILCLEELDCGGDDTPPAVESLPTHLAYVIYTSGSTGRPKGALVTHGNATHLFDATREVFGFGPRDTWALFHSPAFDVSVWEIGGALLNGGRLAIVPRETSLAPAAFYELLCAEKVTVLNQTPGAFRQLLQAEEARPRPGRLSLRLLFLGGEPVTPALLRPWFERHGDTHPRVCVLYGITETTVNVTHRPMSAHDQEERSLIGLPLPGWEAALLDAEGHPVTDGDPGELYIGGPAVCRGYLNRPELTAQRFVPHPLDPGKGGAWYKSGDRARRLPNGELEYLGRIDRQVKIRGFRVELGEIETALAAQEGVAQAAVVARDDADACGKRLCAYLIPRSGARLSREALRAALANRLPPYMVPAAFVFLDALPLTAHGKLDTAALPAPGRESLAAGNETAPPRTPVEKTIAGVWSALLRTGPVGIDDDFFELGGHSLLAAQAAVRIGEALGTRLPVAALFEAPTVRRLAERLGLGGEKARSIPRLPPGEPAPLSPAQQRLWFLQRLEPLDSSYSVPAALALRGSLDIPALERALNEIVRRHAVLRTTFPATDDAPRQIAAPELTLRLPVADLSALPEPARAAEVERRIAGDALAPFDLATGPLLRASILRLGADDHVLLLNLHHIVADGWSLGLLFKEWSALYAAFREGKPSPLAPLPIQYGDFAAWQRASLDGGVFAEQIAYWKERLAQAPACELPPDRPRPEQRTFRGACEYRTLPATLSRALETLCRAEGATLFMTLLAAFKVWLSRQTGQTDLSIGAPFSMRGSAEAEALIGFFINTLVLRTDLSGNPPFRDVLGRVRETALGAYAHQDVPFEKLVEILQPARSLNRTPLFQIFFNQLNFPDEEAVAFPGIETRTLPTLQTTSKFDLTLYVAARAEGIEIQAVYNAALYDGPRIAAMLRQLEHLLAQIAANPVLRIGSYSLVTEEDSALLPDPAAPLPARREESVARRFAEAAARTPERTAVEDQHGAWSYRQLQSAAAAVARTLAEGDIRPGDLVAVYAHRSRALAAALLGTWQAGCAFLVLDPAYPSARLLDYIRLARPQGWLQLEAAGPLPEMLAAFVDAHAWSCRATVPAGCPDAAPPFVPVETPPDALAYLAFTSGSTARPKAIEGTHLPLSHFLRWHTETFGLNADDRVALLSGLSHDPLLRDLFTPLWTGGTLVIPPPEARMEPARLDAWLREAAVSVVHWTPALARLLAEAPGAGSLPALRYAFFGGDRLARRDIEALHRRAPHAACVNFYGATETPQAMAWHRARSESGDPVPLGTGIDGVQLLVLNAEDARAGIGEPGEICIRTPYLSRGYRDNPGETRARFVANPFTGNPQDRVYRTGDRGRVRPDGAVEYLGRADGQIKIRGFRVEPGEIEALLAAHPRVRRAHVRLRGGEKPLLAAYVVPEGKAAPDLQGCLRDYLRQRLPEAMVPAAFVALEALPLTPNGKVDAAALPAPEAESPAEVPGSADLPADPLEYRLQRLWEELLGRASIGVHENFFDLGGHSLLAARLFTQIQTLTGCNLPLATLFRTPTIAQLAALIRGGGWEPLWAALVPIRPGGEKPPLFLVHPVGGNVLGYRELAGHLASDLPIFGLQALGLRQAADSLPCVEAMAAHYVEEIRAVRPHGPYLLAGYSTGGVVAFEMAQQLRAQGEEIRLLALLDSPPSGHWQRPLPARLAGHLRVLLRLPRGEKRRYLEERARLIGRRLARFFPREKASAQEAPAPHVLDDLRASNLRAFRQYRPALYPGPVLLLRSQTRHAFFEEFQREPDEGWRPLAGGGLTVLDVPGDHGQLLGEPNVTVVARRLQEAVDAALRETPQPASAGTLG